MCNNTLYNFCVLKLNKEATQLHKAYEQCKKQLKIMYQIHYHCPLYKQLLFEKIQNPHTM